MSKKLLASAIFVALVLVAGVQSARASKADHDRNINEIKGERLAQQLSKLAAENEAKMSEDKKKVMSAAKAELQKQDFENKALHVGQVAPDISLPNAHGKTVMLKDLLKSGPVILTFYRGSWCPFCNLQLHAYQKFLPQFKKKGAQLVAVTPEKPDLSMVFTSKQKLDFEVWRILHI